MHCGIRRWCTNLDGRQNWENEMEANQITEKKTPRITGRQLPNRNYFICQPEDRGIRRRQRFYSITVAGCSWTIHDQKVTIR
jgi:hypothetical protein